MHQASVWMSSLVMAAAGGWFAAAMFAAPATSKEPSQIAARMTVTQQCLADIVAI